MNDPRLFEFLLKDTRDFVQNINQQYEIEHTHNHAEVERVLRQISSSRSEVTAHLPRQFFVVESVKGKMLYSHMLDHYFKLKRTASLNELFAFIGDQQHAVHYLREFLFWSKASYLFYHHIKNHYEVRQLAINARFPMRLADGECFWVLRETRPLALNRENCLISHISTYTIGNHFDEKEIVDIRFEVFYNNHYLHEWNQKLNEFRFAIQPFELLPAQVEILNYYHQHPGANTVNCAQNLKYPRNTIKKYISDCQHHRGIIDKARVSFPHITFNCMHQVIHYLEKIGWFKK